MGLSLTSWLYSFSAFEKSFLLMAMSAADLSCFSDGFFFLPPVAAPKAPWLKAIHTSSNRHVPSHRMQDGTIFCARCRLEFDEKVRKEGEAGMRRGFAEGVGATCYSQGCKVLNKP